MSLHRAPKGPNANYLDDPLPSAYIYNEFGPDFSVTKCPSNTENLMLADMATYDPDDYDVSEMNAYVISNIVKNLQFSISNNFNWGGNPQHIRENVYEIFDKRLREFTPQQLDDPDYQFLIKQIRKWRNMVEVPTTHNMAIPLGPQ